jgi:hypothetical protein
MQSGGVVNQLGKFAKKEFLAPHSGRFHKSERTQGVARGLMPVGAFSAESSSYVVFTPMLNLSDLLMHFGDRRLSYIASQRTTVAGYMRQYRP